MKAKAKTQRLIDAIHSDSDNTLSIPVMMCSGFEGK